MTVGSLIGGRGAKCPALPCFLEGVGGRTGLPISTSETVSSEGAKRANAFATGAVAEGNHVLHGGVAKGCEALRLVGPMLGSGFSL